MGPLSDFISPFSPILVEGGRRHELSVYPHFTDFTNSCGKGGGGNYISNKPNPNPIPTEVLPTARGGTNRCNT